MHELSARAGRWEGRRTELAVGDPPTLIQGRVIPVVETWEPAGPRAMRLAVQLDGRPFGEFRFEGAEDGLILTRLDDVGRPPLLLRRTRMFPGGSYTAEDPERQLGGAWGVELSVIEAGRRIALFVAYDGVGALRRVMLADVVQNRAFTPPAWRAGREACLGEWSGEGLRWRGAEALETTASGIILADEGDTFLLQWRSGPAGETWQGMPAGEAIDFPAQGVTLFFLPVGGWAFFPRRVEPGRPVTVELAWQPEPNRQLRILRAYAADGSWLQTSLIREARVGGPEG
jgi:hypothetical protein